MNLKEFKKKGTSTDYVIKWIITVAIIVAVSLAIRTIVIRYSG